MLRSEALNPPLKSPPFVNKLRGQRASMQRARQRQTHGTKTVKRGAMNKNKFQKHRSHSHVSAAAQLRRPRPSQRRQRQFRHYRRTWTTGPAKTPSPRLPWPPDQPSPPPVQQLVARTPLLHHGHVRKADFAQKNSPAGPRPVWASNIATPPTR
jgi:hypothetical protein